MTPAAKRTIARWIHILFGATVLAYIYAPQNEVQPYVFFFRAIYLPIILLSGLYLWKGHLLSRLFAKKS